METTAKRYIKLFPWFEGFTLDLLFYIAIDTLFLTVVKQFSSAEIVSITSISLLVSLALQIPLLLIINKIGNTASLRAGAFLLLLSSLLITLGKNYYIVLFGRIFHDISASFHVASTVALENSLDLIDKRNDFVKIRAASLTVYSVLTMLISFVASLMFNLNPYLPMIGCITTCSLGFIFSLFMKDSSAYDKIAVKKETGCKTKIHYSKIVVIAIVLYSIFYVIVNSGQAEGKLFIQENILLDFNVEQTALIMGAIVCSSRIIRVISNMIFNRLYKKYQAKMGVALTVLLCFSIALILFGSFIPQIIIKIVVMAMGYTVILFARDPFKLYIQDVVFVLTPKEQHQSLLIIMAAGVNLLRGGIGLVFSALLLKFPMLLIISIMFVISLVEIILGIIVYRSVQIGKEAKCTNA